MNKVTYNFIRWINKNDSDKKYHSYFQFFYDKELLYSDINDYVYQYGDEKNLNIDFFDENGIFIKNNENKKHIYFDVDGTFYNLYGYENWLECILSEKIECYTQSDLLVDENAFIECINNLKNKNYVVGIITWLSKKATKQYENKVRSAKYRYINKHFPDLFNEIHILQYGKNKSIYCHGKNYILFDDEQNNRIQWQQKKGVAYNVTNIIDTLQKL